MTLKEKFNNKLIEVKQALYKPYVQAEECEQIADDYAIEFGNFIERIKDADIDSIEYHSYLNNNMDELLEIFKKEKGL